MAGEVEHHRLAAWGELFLLRSLGEADDGLGGVGQIEEVQPQVAGRAVLPDAEAECAAMSVEIVSLPPAEGELTVVEPHVADQIAERFDFIEEEVA